MGGGSTCGRAFRLSGAYAIGFSAPPPVANASIGIVATDGLVEYADNVFNAHAVDHVSHTVAANDPVAIPEWVFGAYAIESAAPLRVANAATDTVRSGGKCR